MNLENFAKKIQTIKEKLFTNPLTKRFLRGSIWSITGNLGSQVFAILASIASARLLGKEQFGQFGMIISTVATFGTFAGIGLGLTATKYISQFLRDDEVKTGQIVSKSYSIGVISSSLMAVIVFIAAPLIAQNVLNSTGLTNQLRVASLLLFINSINGIQSGILAGFEAFRKISLINLIKNLIYLPITIIGIYFFDLMGAIWANILVGALAYFLFNRSISRECEENGINRNEKGWGETRTIICGFSFPALLSNIMTGLFLWLANTILVNQPSGYNELALINVSNQWRPALLFFPMIFSNVALPLMSSTNQNIKAKDEFISVMEMTQDLIAFIIIPLSTLFMLTSKSIMKFYGSDYSGGTNVLIIIILGASISAIGSAAGTAIQAKGKMWLGAFMNATWGVAYILLSYFLVSRLGALALSIGFLSAHILLATWSYSFLFVSKNISGKMVKKIIFSGMYLIVIALLAIYVNRGLEIAQLIPIAILCSVASLFLPFNNAITKNLILKLLPTSR